LLTRVSDAVVDMAPYFLRLSVVGIEPAREVAFVEVSGEPVPPPYDPAKSFPLALIPETGDFPSHELRRQSFWQPGAAAPSYLHLAWLLEDLGQATAELADAGVTVARIDSPSAEYVDVTFTSDCPPRSGTHRIRFRLEDRAGPLEFPAMYVRDLFASGDHDRLRVSGEGVIDLRDIL
jgi:hypothetical protein